MIGHSWPVKDRNVYLMESLYRENQVISFTSWESQQDGDAYESSGVYVQNVNVVCSATPQPAS